MCLGQVWVECNGASGGIFSLRHRFPGRDKAVLSHVCVGVRQAGISQRELRIARNRLPVTFYGFVIGYRLVLIEDIETFLVKVVGLQVARRLAVGNIAGADRKSVV